MIIRCTNSSIGIIDSIASRQECVEKMKNTLTFECNYANNRSYDNDREYSC